MLKNVEILGQFNLGFIIAKLYDDGLVYYRAVCLRDLR